MVAREKKAGITMALTNPMMNLLLNLGLTLVIVVGAFRVDAGLTQPGKIIAFLSYFTIILNAMMAVTRIFVMCSPGHRLRRPDSGGALHPGRTWR